MEYSTDGKVRWVTTEEDINQRLASVLGEKFVNYRKLWDAANNFEVETEFPLFLHVELNQVCNLRCPMCPIGIPEVKAKYLTNKRMTWELYSKIILEGEEHGCPSMSPQGIDEPLLTANLEDYIRFAADHGFIDIMMNTNATLLTQEWYKRLLDSGLTRLRFSLDAATKETFEKIRLGAKYEVVMRNIDHFLELRAKGGYQLPLVGVNLCRTKLNEHEVDKFLEKWEGIADFVVLQEFVPPETERDYSEFYPTQSKLRDEMLLGFNCVQPWQRVVIRNTGEVCPCCAFFSIELAVGNVREHTIYELWNGEAMRNLRQMHKEGRYWDNPWCLKCVNSILGKPGETKILEVEPKSKKL